jgi:heavy metal sensor kinase
MKPGWRSRSLRLRISLGYAAAGTTLLALFSAAVYLYVDRRIARPPGHPLSDPYALHALLLALSVALPVVAAVLALGGYVLTGHWLAPLDQMAAEASRITADALSRRLPVLNPADEFGQLATAFNVTLDRLEDSFVTLDNFVADASHELRTPLTTLRSVGEVGLRRSRTVEEYREIIGSMLEEAQRLQLLIERILELARAEGGAEAVQLRLVRLDECVANCLDELRILADHREQRLVFDGAPCSAETDPVIFRQALQNLVDNAIKYSPPGSTIAVRVRREASACVVTVDDEGPGIAPELRPQITRRFFRTDRSRGRSGGGFGLGLAVTKAYVRILRGSLAYEPRRPRGSRFTLALPTAD